MHTIKELQERLARHSADLEKISATVNQMGNKQAAADVGLASLFSDRLVILFKQDIETANYVYGALEGHFGNGDFTPGSWDHLPKTEQEMWISLTGFIRNNRKADIHQLHTHRYLYLISRGEFDHPSIMPFKNLDARELESLRLWIDYVHEFAGLEQVYHIPKQQTLNLFSHLNELCTAMEQQIFYLQKLREETRLLCEADRMMIHNIIDLLIKALDCIQNNNQQTEAA